MSTDEDTELRDLIVQSLEANGVIDKMKAELRAAIFLALEEEGNIRDKIPLINKNLRDFLANPEGKKIISLVWEFLNFFNMDCTLSVFEPETSNSAFLRREELCKEYNLLHANSDLPVIAELLKVNSLLMTKDQFNLTFTTNETNMSSKIENPTENCNNIATNLYTMPFSDLSKGNSKMITSNSFGKSNFNHLADSLKCTNEKNKGSYHDPFYDELDSQSSIGLNSMNDIDMNSTSDKAGESDFDTQSKINGDFKVYPRSNESKEITSLFSQLYSKSEDSNFVSSIKHKESKILPVSSKSEISERSLSSLRDLPALNVNPKNLYNLEKDKVSAMKSYEHNSNSVDDRHSDEDEDSEKSERSNKSTPKSQENSNSANRCDLESHENSEQSIEEEIEDEVSAAYDDLFSSISVGDETTNDATVSQISNVAGIDHIENSLNV